MTSLDLDGATLTVGGRSLWLESEGQRVPAVRLRYDEGRLRDRLEVAGRWYDVPRGRGKALMRLLAEHRLRASDGIEEALAHAFVEERDELETLGLESWLERGELVLAYLHTSTDVAVESELGPRHDVPWRFVWTDRRAALLAVGPLGDLLTWPVDSFTVESRTGRDLVHGTGPEGELTWRATLGNENRFGAIAPVLAAARLERLRAVVDASRSAEHREAVAALLAHDDDPRAPVEQALLAGESPRTTEAFVATMTPDELLAWADGWAFEAAARRVLVGALRDLDSSSPHALALGEGLWTEARAEDPVGADLERAAHLHAAGDIESAKAVLEASLAELPAPEIAELVPPGDPHAHLTDRVRLLEALAPLDAGAHMRLARIQPLSRARLVATESVAAVRALEVVEGGFDEPAGLPRDPTPLTDETLSALRHPMSVTDRFTSTLQGLVATVETPDHSALRRFCAPLKRPDAVAAFEEARAFLGVDATCYVSRGEDATGCRAHDDAGGGFVVLGARHVEEGPLRMSTGELRFVFACELAHLRLGHARVTQSDMWRGVLDKGLSGAELLLMALPLVRRVKIPDAVGTILGAVKDGKAGQVWDKATGLFRRKKDDDASDGMVEREALLVTHRLMQLSADRIGLELAGDPGPAVRSMLVLRGEDDLEGVAVMGLSEWVLRRQGGQLVDPDLAVRVTALLANWLDRCLTG
ncbi:MAG: hypothetical protein JJ863_27865 [Deltaproteobacteria bacterium]|nr:hypothetical protein [Deltaproteobacteria bacterium]